MHVTHRAALVAAAALAISVTPALAADAVKDAAYDDTLHADPWEQLNVSAQTFTTINGGSLAEVTLYCMGWGEGDDVATVVDLYAVDQDGVPTGTSLGQATTDPDAAVNACNSGGAWIGYAFASPVAVDPATQYAMVWNGFGAFGRDGESGYGDGQWCYQVGQEWTCSDMSDYVFATWVAAADPTPVDISMPPSDAVRAGRSLDGGTGVAPLLLALAGLIGAAAATSRLARRA